MLLFLPEREGSSWQAWTFSKGHADMYQRIVDDWNARHGPESAIDLAVFGIPALERRLLSGFLSDTPVPDLVEIEANMAGRFFSGPMDAIGFIDLTDKLEAEGLMDIINIPSFGPWTRDERIFGLPHDVHPVLLAYRADIVEAAGIDVSEIETWDDFVRILGPLMYASGGTTPDRYLINLWETNANALEMLLLQRDSRLFGRDGWPDFAHAEEADLLATIVRWTSGPDRIAINAPDFSAEGNQLFLEGRVICNLMPDWMTGVWMEDLPGLAGKVKLMPLPAWEKGGRRTSVYGGTMLGIPKRAQNPELAWEFAKELYLSEEVAEALYIRNGIITPVKRHWGLEVFDAPNAYFSGQPAGRLYIDAAPDIPERVNSPYRPLVLARMGNALMRTKRYAVENNQYDQDMLAAFALQELKAAEEYVRTRMQANRFLSPDAGLMGEEAAP